MLTVIAVAASACSSARSAAPVLLPVNAEPSAIYDMHGTLITTLREENRSSVPLERIPSVLQDAVVAIEDARFWEHKGVDPRAVARAVTNRCATGPQQSTKQRDLGNTMNTFLLPIQSAFLLPIQRDYFRPEILFSLLCFDNRVR